MLTGQPDEVAAALVEFASLAPGRLVVLIDGGSGSGKTQLAASFEHALGRPLQVVHMDDCYPGWDGLAAGSTQVPGMLTGRRPGYWRWDWHGSRPVGWVDLDPVADLLVEGCGTISPDSAQHADLTVWCELDAAARKHRALARDGAMFRDHWDSWARQERELWARNHPSTLAGVTVQVE